MYPSSFTHINRKPTSTCCCYNSDKVRKRVHFPSIQESPSQDYTTLLPSNGREEEEDEDREIRSGNLILQLNLSERTLPTTYIYIYLFEYRRLPEDSMRIVLATDGLCSDKSIKIHEHGTILFLVGSIVECAKPCHQPLYCVCGSCRSPSSIKFRKPIMIIIWLSDFRSSHSIPIIGAVGSISSSRPK